MFLYETWGPEEYTRQSDKVAEMTVDDLNELVRYLKEEMEVHADAKDTIRHRCVRVCVYLYMFA